MAGVADDNAWAKLGRHFAEAQQEVQSLHALRHFWKNLVAMQQARPEGYHDSFVNGALSQMYVHTIAVGIRRQSESRDTRATIGSLLRRMSENPHIVTRERVWGGRVDKVPAGRNAWLARADSKGEQLRPDLVEERRAALATSVAPARRWANQRIAHLDPSRGPGRALDPLTFGELHAGLDALGDALKWIFPIFNGGNTILWSATPDPPLSWLRAFAEPWVDLGSFTPVPIEEFA